MSAILVNHLAISGALALVVTIKSDAPVPDAIAALWKDRGFSRLRIDGFDSDQTGTILAATLGGPVESITTHRLAEASHGNPRCLRQLVEGSLTSGTLRCTSGIWQLRGEPAVTPELTLRLRRQCAHAPDTIRRIVALVAFGEPLELAILRELVSTQSLLDAETSGLIRFTKEDSTLVARLVHPFFGTAVRSSLSADDARQAREELVPLLTNDASGQANRIRAAELTLGTDYASSGLLASAAADAIALGSYDRAEALARAATAEGGGFRATLIRAGALAWTSRGADAELLLTTADTTCSTSAKLTRLAILRAGNLFWNLDSPDRACAALNAARARIGAGSGRECLDGVRAAIELSIGRAGSAAESAVRIRLSKNAPPAARMWAASTGCVALALMGRGDEVRPWARSTAAYVQSDTAVLRFAIGHGEIMALIYTGNFDSAEQSVRRYLELAGTHDPAAFGITALFGRLELARGLLRAARARLEEAAAALGQSNPEWRVLTSLFLAQTLAMSGRPVDANKAIERAEASRGQHRKLYTPELGIAKAWAAAAACDVGLAISLARRAAVTAEESGLLAVAAEAWHTAVRFGDEAAAPKLAALIGLVDGLLIAPMAAHAAAAAASDVDGLRSAAAQFDIGGAKLLAADAYAQAAAAYRRAGNRREQLRTSARAYTLARTCGAHTPAIRAGAAPLPLTQREREIGLLVADGLTNHGIAERLTVSSRTVEGHIYHMFMKLEVADRKGMAETMRTETLP
ncbi:LuxR C-terminal-related transcriptional regulator [Rhodococcus sp. NPDC058521]|uniref:helix-turn-helix transcriptional regulator n=1 Tax=Rhodococcus sp. NPDC058521 TaxID=3346536 RepID=UPI003663062D